MAKKAKAKQKTDEKAAPNNVGSNPPPPPGAMGNMDTNFGRNSPVGSQVWGNTTGAWETAEAPTGGDTWGVSRHEQEDAWGDQTGGLLQPPGHTHSILPTIPEQASSYNQSRRSVSDIGESQGSYRSSWNGSQHPQYTEGQPGQNLATAPAPSVIGSPAPPAVSLMESAIKLKPPVPTEQKRTSASDEARKLEEQKSRFNAQPTQPAITSPATHFVPLKDHSNYTAGGHTPMSSASQAAALYESTTNRLKNQNNQASKPPQPSAPAQPGKTTWTYPKPLTPNSRPAAAIPPDASWTMTGGNTWSNKHRQTKSATVHWPEGSENTWGQQMHQHRMPQQQMHQQQTHQQQMYQQQMHQQQMQPQHPHQQVPQHMHFQGHPGPSQPQQHSQHRKHHSHPVQPTHQQRPPPGQTSWQDWGNDRWEEEEESLSDSEDTIDGQGQHGTDAWGRQGGAGGWDQQGGAWGQQGQQQQQHARGAKQPQGRGRGAKNVEDEWYAGWGQGEDAWGQSNDGLQGHGRGHVQEQAHGRGRGQNAQHAQGQGQGRGQVRVDNGWGQSDDGWGKAAEGGWGKAPDVWGKTSETGWGKTSETGWDQAHDEWPTVGHAPSISEWGNVQQNKSHGIADLAVNKNQVSEQHRAQIMNTMLNQVQNQKNSNMTTAQHQAAQQHAAQLQAQLAAMQGKIPQKPKSAENKNVWEAYGADGWGSMNSSDDEYDVNRRVHFSPKASELWGGSPRSVPSKTLAQAQQQPGIATTPINLTSNVRFVESKGAAFSFVSNAFFGNARLARERIHWMFPANKDERVADMLAWVQKMSFNLATFGLIKFLETHERGALFVNVLFRMRQHPNEPAFDWLTFNQLQGTMDKTLQESVAFYDPSKLVTVFVYLPSQTGNSIAIWRRKINVPDSAKLKYKAEINAVTKTLRSEKDYVVMVDELPKAKPKVPQKGQLRKLKSVKVTAKSPTKVKTTSKDSAQAKAQKKRKWWKLFLS